MDADALLDGLTPAQRAAVVSDATPLCIQAGAGSGKTRVLTRRIAYRIATGTAEADHVLAVTFTRKAAGALRRRLRDCGVTGPVAAGTIHGVAFAQLRQWYADRQAHPPALLADKARVLGPLFGTSDRRLLARLEAEISWAQARCIDPASYSRAAAEAARRPPVDGSTIADLFARYEADKRRRRVLDLDDLLARCALALETDPDFARGQRWRWRHFFVDEYQDLSPSHERLLAAWTGGRLDLCVVGDPQQSIYGWNGADPSLLIGFTDRYPTSTVLRLTANFRSTPEILAVADAALAGSPAAEGLAGSDAPNDPGPVPTVQAYASDEDEAAGIVRQLRDGHRPGVAWAHFAVLARTNAQLGIISLALASAAIPHEHRGDRARTASAAGALLVDYRASMPARSVAIELRLDHDEEVAARREGEAEAPKPTGPRGEVERVTDALSEYLDLDAAGTVGGFLTWLRSSATGDDQPDRDDVVSLCTFHRAKGLEWPVVFVAGLADGIVPLSVGGGADQRAEERRLLYVALTRARYELHCSWARRGTQGGRAIERAPSPLLGSLQLAVTALTSARQPIDPRPRLRLLRAASERSGDGAPAGCSGQDLLDDLRRWRAGAARAAGVSPAAVLRDETLVAVAATRPSSHDALAALPGFGPVAARRWGPVLLDAVARHAG